MTVDGVWATIGSTNLDTRLFALNEELNAVLYDKDVAGQLEKIFADDLRYSRRIDDARGGTRGFLNRLLELISLLFAYRCSGAAASGKAARLGRP